METMYNIPVNATEEQIKIIDKYIKNKDINLSQEFLKKVMEIIEDYEDTQKALESIRESKGYRTYSFDEILKENGINKDEL